MEFTKIELHKLWINYATKLGLPGPIFPLELKCPWCNKMMNFYEAYDFKNSNSWEIGFIIPLEKNGDLHYKNWQPIHISCNGEKNLKDQEKDIIKIDDLTVLESIVVEKVEEPIEPVVVVEEPVVEESQEFDFDPDLGIEVVDEIKFEKPKKIKPIKPEKPKREAKPEKESKEFWKPKNKKVDNKVNESTQSESIFASRVNRNFESSNIQERMDKKIDKMLKKRKF
ncbi:HNH endonuclease [Spiroplasma endosymbiont of Panorpa germanica]|uniref:HNH endonuclease n=1 Tax=Spiroplasma endosymbiont of Panorpa germanica TaxID=3066314 RepID=UPI0030D4265E